MEDRMYRLPERMTVRAPVWRGGRRSRFAGCVHFRNATPFEVVLVAGGAEPAELQRTESGLRSEGYIFRMVHTKFREGMNEAVR